MATSSSPLFNVRVIAAPPPPEFELNINMGAWWPNSTRTDMSYSNAHLHMNGRCIELCWAQHSRAPGDHTSVRWTDFTANGPPTLGYYWPENDPLIAETDNFPSLYMPWRQWVCYWNQKVIDIGSGTAIARNQAEDVRDKVAEWHRRCDSGMRPRSATGSTGVAAGYAMTGTDSGSFIASTFPRCAMSCGFFRSGFQMRPCQRRIRTD
jgi:hypothetical protein